jgi:hypothetical protein
MTDTIAIADLQNAKAQLLAEVPREPMIHFMHRNEYEFHKANGDIRGGAMHGPPILIIAAKLGDPHLTVAEYEAGKR